MQPAQHSIIAPSDGAKLHVLIVDDSLMQLRILHAMLDRWGFAVSQATSAEDALRLCSENPPDLIISDWVMPGMSGPDLCRAFRALPRERYGYFVLLTSKSEKADVTAGLEAGADDFLTKPVSAPELRARLAAGTRIVSMERVLNDKNREVTAALDELRTLHEEIDRDLQEARTIQQALVPERSRVIAGSRISVLLQPCGHVGGDLVGMFDLGDVRAGFYAIDVSGHGITSAMVTARVAGYLSSRFPDQNLALEPRFERFFALRPPHIVAEALNARLTADPGVDSYLTMAYVAADLESGRCRMVQAGHPPPLLIAADGSTRFVGDGGMPIGLVPDVPYETVEFRLTPGDRLLIYSDGFTEATLKCGAMLEEDGLLRLYRASAESGATGEELLQDMFWRLTTELAATELSDDVSAVLLEFGSDGALSQAKRAAHKGLIA